MDTVLFDGVTVELAVRAAGVVLALILIKRLIGGGSRLESTLSVHGTCPRCGWIGTVTKYNPTCRRCGSTLGLHQ